MLKQYDPYDDIYPFILDPDESSFTPGSHHDPRILLEHPKHWSHEDYKSEDDESDQEEQQKIKLITNCLERIKNFLVTSQQWTDEGEAAWIEIELGLDHKPKSNSFCPSLDDDEDLDETDPKETLANVISNECHDHETMETNSFPRDIHEESPLEFDQEDRPNSHKKSPESINLFYFVLHKIFNPLIFLPPINFKRVVVDAYVYHKYSRSR
jgi:hypothetical protein